MKAGETVSFLFSLGSRLRLRLDGRRRRRLSEINRLVEGRGRDGNRKDKKTGGREEGGFWRDKKVQSFFVPRGEKHVRGA